METEYCFDMNCGLEETETQTNQYIEVPSDKFNPPDSGVTVKEGIITGSVFSTIFALWIIYNILFD